MSAVGHVYAHSSSIFHINTKYFYAENVISSIEIILGVSHIFNNAHIYYTLNGFL